MAQQSEFVAFLLDHLRAFGEVSARPMFGGYGVYHNGLIFGLVADGCFYLKADEQTRGHFEAAGLAPFSYVKEGKSYPMSYFEAPPEALENADEMQKWAALGFQAALRKAMKKKK